MEMQVDPQLIKTERQRRAWSQSHLASVAGLGLRTVQRIEATGNASYESAAAIAAVFSIPVAILVSSGAPQTAQREHMAARWQRPMRMPLQSAAAVGAVVATTLLVVSLRAPNGDAVESQSAGSREEPVAVAANEVAPVNCLAVPVRGQAQLNLDIECETVDLGWAPLVERELRSLALGYLADSPDLSERFNLARVRCRTTICELLLVNSAPTGAIDYDPSTLHADVDLWRKLGALKGEIHIKPWGAQFDARKAMSIGSLAEGEQRIYVQRLAPSIARL